MKYVLLTVMTTCFKSVSIGLLYISVAMDCLYDAPVHLNV